MLSQAIVKVQEKREERLGGNLLNEMHRVQRKAWELLGKMESEGDHRGSVVALREVRECMESLGEMLARAEALAPARAKRLSRWFTSERNETLGSWAELRLIRVGQHLWAWQKRSYGKGPQVIEKLALYAALEDVWRCKRELRAELKANRAAKVRIENGRFVVNVGFSNQRSSASSYSQGIYGAS